MKHTTDNNPCSAFRANLDQWLARELDADHSVDMQVHHDGCAACQLETRLARAIDTITAALPEPACPALKLPVAANPATGLVARLLAAWRQPLVYVPAFAAVLVTLLVLQLPQLRVADPAPDPDRVLIDGRAYTREEIVQAAADLELALRYLDKYASFPARVVSAELEHSRLPLPPPPAERDAPSI